MPVCDEVDMKISDDRMSTRPPQVARPCLRSITTERGREVLRKRSRVLSRRPPPPCVTSDGRETVGLTDQVNNQRSHCRATDGVSQIVVVMPVSIFASTGMNAKKNPRERRKKSLPDRTSVAACFSCAFPSGSGLATQPNPAPNGFRMKWPTNQSIRG